MTPEQVVSQANHKSEWTELVDQFEMQFVDYMARFRADDDGVKREGLCKYIEAIKPLANELGIDVVVKLGVYE